VFIRVKMEFNAFFISLFLKSAYMKNHIQFEQNGASKEAFNLGQIANIPLVLPPLPEQKAIAAYLDRKTAQLDDLVGAIERQVEQLHALRRSLINAVVTGQLKVAPS
jgi:type I restriction enzyme S subunit